MAKRVRESAREKRAPFTRSHITHRWVSVERPASVYYGYFVGSVLRRYILGAKRGRPMRAPDLHLNLADREETFGRRKLLTHLCEVDDESGIIKVVVLLNNLPNHPVFYETFYFSPDPDDETVLPPFKNKGRITSVTVGYPTYGGPHIIDNTHLGTRDTHEDG